MMMMVIMKVTKTVFICSKIKVPILIPITFEEHSMLPTNYFLNYIFGQRTSSYVTAPRGKRL